jgi:hypothetical protein
MREQHRTPDWAAELGSGTDLEQGLLDEIAHGRVPEPIHVGPIAIVATQTRFRLGHPGLPVQFRALSDLDALEQYAADHPAARATTWFLFGEVVDGYIVAVGATVVLVAALPTDRPMQPASDTADA